MQARTRDPNVLSRKVAIVLAMLFVIGNIKLINTAGVSVRVEESAALAGVTQEETEVAPRQLATVGITFGQTARINVVNSPDPNSAVPPSPITVEMCFHDSNGDLILDRFRNPVQKSATIDPHHGDSLDLNGGLVSGPG